MLHGDKITEGFEVQIQTCQGCTLSSILLLFVIKGVAHAVLPGKSDRALSSVRQITKRMFTPNAQTSCKIYPIFATCLELGVGTLLHNSSLETLKNIKLQTMDLLVNLNIQRANPISSIPHEAKLVILCPKNVFLLALGKLYKLFDSAIMSSFISPVVSSNLNFYGEI